MVLQPLEPHVKPGPPLGYLDLAVSSPLEADLEVDDGGWMGDLFFSGDNSVTTSRESRTQNLLYRLRCMIVVVVVRSALIVGLAPAGQADGVLFPYMDTFLHGHPPYMGTFPCMGTSLVWAGGRGSSRRK